MYHDILNEFYPLGDATDSFLFTILVGGIFSIIGLVIGFLVRRADGSDDTKWIENRPILLPSIIFLFTIFIVMIIVPLPISSYGGPNVYETRIWEDRSAIFEVRDETYYPIVECTASTTLSENQASILYLDFVLEGETKYSLSMEFQYSSEDDRISQYVILSDITPATYILEIHSDFYEDGILQPDRATQYRLTLSQRLLDGHIEELALYDTFKFILIVLSFVVLLGGICLDLEEMKNYRPGVRHRRGSIYNPRYQ